MRPSWISWETTATFLLLYTTYRYAVNVTSSSSCNAATNPTALASFVAAATDVDGGHATCTINQDEELRSYQEPTQRPSNSIVPPHSSAEEEDDIILLDHHDSSPVLRSETNEEEEDSWKAASHQPSKNPTTTINQTTTSHNNNTKNTTADDVIVMALVDGTLVGLSRSTGQTLWKHCSPEPTTTSTPIRVGPEVAHPPQQQQRHPLAKPLVSTTTTIGSAGSHHRHQSENQQQRPQFRNTVAVPSILDGKVYLTSTSEDCGNWGERHRLDDDDDADATHQVCDLVEDTVTTTIHDLMVRTPFVDLKNHGRIYTSQRHSVAVAIHSTTGQPIRTITTSSTSSRPSSSPTDPLVAISETDVHDDDNANTDDILWLGRTDYTISVHEPTTGDLDVQFTMAEMMSIHDMLLLENDSDNQKKDQQQQLLRQYLLPQNSLIENDNDDTMTHRAVSSSSSSTRAAYGMIATPNGHVAYRNLYTGQIVWVAAEAFLNTPAVYAFDAKTGRSIRVDIVPDVISPHGTMEYVSNELQKQFYEQQYHQNPYDSTMGMNEPVFGAIPGTGQIYAIPLIQKVAPHQKQLQHSIPDAARAYVTGQHGMHQHYTHPYDQPPLQQQPPYCHPNSPHYPRCLNHYGNHIYGSGGPDRYIPYDHHRPFRNKFPNALSDVSSIQSSKVGYDDTRAADDDAVGSSGAIVPFYHPDYGYQYIPPDHFYTINTEWNEQYRRRKRYKKIMRTVTSWLVPTIVAALFVTVRHSLAILSLCHHLSVVLTRIG